MSLKTIAVSIIIILNSLNLNAQYQFTQFKLSKHNLVGKTDPELRIMRNEIFAVHGYIFHSEDLAQYFKMQPWYKPLYQNVDDKLTDIDKFNIDLIKEFEKTGKVRRVLMDSSYSYMVHAFQEKDLNYQRTVEVTYPGYEWKKTVDKAVFGAETEPTIIKMEYLNEAYNSHDKEYWQLRKPVDKMILENNYIQTVKYNWPEGYSELYAFFNDIPFLKFTGQNFYKVRIPNGKLKSIYIGLENITDSDKNVFAKIYLGTTNEGIKNILTLKSKNSSYFIHENKFTIFSSNSRDKVNGRELELWSSSKAIKNSELTTFHLKLEFQKELEIVVENGLINGSMELNQSMWIE